MNMSYRFLFFILFLGLSFSKSLSKDGAVVVIEAEDFFEQTLTQERSWKITKKDHIPEADSDGDPPHIDGASEGAYIEVLPDTRRNHGEKLIHGENFSDEPGKVAIIGYKVQFPEAGKYYVWARAYSSGTEDNGFHIGLNGEWPESGQRWQTVVKKRWHWECKQRTQKVHSGVPMQLYLDIPSAGKHEIQISMREDGCELDQILFATDVEYRPEGYHRDKAPSPKPLVIEKGPDGDGSIEVSGELKQWHNISITLKGPWAHERGEENPFLDYQFSAVFEHEESGAIYHVPGYFAADGSAGSSSSESGTCWRVHFSPAMTGSCQYSLTMYQARGIAIDESKEKVADVFSGEEKAGKFEIAASNQALPDFRARGRLEYVGERYLRFAGDGTRFLKAGPDAPETFLAYTDFDCTTAANPGKGKLKTWAPHIRDWNNGDPVWKDEKGKGIIGALNYLSAKGLNTFSFLTYNAGGDGDNVWPFIERDEKLRYDCSKLDQWGIVFDHATKQGLHLHFKLQETEMDDNRHGHKESENADVPTSLDGGKLGPERKLYLRELIARYGHHLALNWNLGEENTQSMEEIRAMAEYIRNLDPYNHPIVLHTFPDQQDKVYDPLLGVQSPLTGVSLQNSWSAVHQRTLHWIQASGASGKQWVVANDEQNPADLGVPPDPGYEGHSGKAEKGGKSYDLHDIRRDTLWGNLMAGGAGVEYYFGYKLPQNDLLLEDFRSRDRSWDFCRVALKTFHMSGLPFWEMENANELVGNPKHENGKPWCLAKADDCYLVYLPDRVDSVSINLGEEGANFEIKRWDPLEDRAGKELFGVEKAKGEVLLKNPSSPKSGSVFSIERVQ